MQDKIHGTTVFFASLSLFLAGATIFVTWKLLSEPATSIPQAGGSSVKLGLPINISGDTRQFTASSAVLLNSTNNQIMFEQRGFDRRPIASITKLMTAMVALDHGIDWDAPANIAPEEYVQGGQLILHPGEEVTMRDLFNASLLGSANNATLAYVRQLDIPKEEFVKRMNRKAIELGLEQTEFSDVTGLDLGNLSTAYEVAVMATTAFTKYPEISQATSQHEYSFTVIGSGREHTIRNTNKLISDNKEEVLGSKTGYLYEAQYCLVMQGAGELANRVAVILGNPSEQSHFAETDRLLHLVVP